MDLRLHLLESFRARAADGTEHKVCAYERMARDESLQDGGEHWEPTGVLEYRLEDGRMVDARQDGSLRIAANGTELTPLQARQPAPGATGATGAKAQAKAQAAR